MPFVSQDSRAFQSVQPPFVGRAAERQIFRQQILEPEAPATHLLGVWGPAGIGVSTLLAQWRADARSAPFQDRCVVATADGHLGSPLRVMTTYATQLRAEGLPLVAFEQLLAHLTAPAFRSSSPEHLAARTLFARQVQELARAQPLRGLPVLGGMYESVSETTRQDVLQQYPALAVHTAQGFAERLATLTHAFLDDLNWLAGTPVLSRPGQGRRMLLFLDEVSPATDALLSWVREQILPASLSTEIVFILASSEPLEHLLPNEPTLTSLSLPPLATDEAGEFLVAWGITDPAHQARLFARTGGLPLALRMLAPVPLSWLDTDEPAIAAGVRWLEQQAPGYPYLMRYAALFSRAFDHPDLTVCPMFSASELILWYRRLLALPFVSGDLLTGEQRYHPLVQQYLRQQFASEAPTAYRQARQVIAQYYQRQGERGKPRQEPSTLFPDAQDQLALARLEQWFWLADEHSLKQAIAQTLDLLQHTMDQSALLTLLRAFAHASPAEAVPAPGTHVATLLLAYGEAEIHHPAFLEAVTALIAYVEHLPAFSARLQAHLLRGRAAALLLQDQTARAREDSRRAVALDPTEASGVLLQGIACAALGEMREALAAFDQTLHLSPQQVNALAHRALAHRAQKAYELALEESTRVVSLAPDLSEAALLRTLIYADLELRRQGLGPFEGRLARDPNDSEAYLLQGMARCALGQYEQALDSFARAQALVPTDPRIYAGRGHVFLELGDLAQAQENLACCWEINPQDGTIGLLLAWVRLCQDEPDTQVSALLETVAQDAGEPAIQLLGQGMTYLLQQQFAEALAVLDQAQQLHSHQGEAAFWKGLVCVYLEQDAEALEALKQAQTAEFPLPAVLFTPVRRVALVRPAFYHEHLQPLLQAIFLTSPAREP